jgi:uncharacterized protein (TIGR03437 family)
MHRSRRLAVFDLALLMGWGVHASSMNGTSGTPVVAVVQDAASDTVSIAQGSYFSVYGSNLAPFTIGTTAFPRPTSTNGVKVTVTPASGGNGTDAYLVWVGPGQINAILPSTVPAGASDVTVTNGTVSSPFAVQVVASKMALFTQDQTGAGLAVLQNYIPPTEYDVNRLTTGTFSGVPTSPAKPGQTLVAWGTGLGPYAAADNAAGVYHDFSTSQTISAIVGGVSIPVTYAGLAGYPGIDQINFTLPNNIPTGCSVPLQISLNGALSPMTYISIAPNASAASCVQPGYTTQQLQAFDQGTTIGAGSFSISQISQTVPSYGAVRMDSVGGAFSQITGFELAVAAGLNYRTAASGSCQVFQIASSGGTAVTHLTNLDAGTITLTGPPGTNLTNQKLTEESTNGYKYTIGMEGVTIPGQTSFTLVPGTYLLTGSGGKEVGPFSASVELGSAVTLNSPLPSAVTESAGLTIGWQGGNASDLVQISGSSSTSSGTGSSEVTTFTEFVCITTVGQNSFTVPAFILKQLPATPGGQSNPNSAGLLSVASGPTPASFNATLNADGSNIAGTLSAFAGYAALVTYQ